MQKHYILPSLLACSLLSLTACGGSDSGSNSPSPTEESNKAPHAVINPAATTVEVNQPLNVSAAQSTDDDGNIVSYHWSSNEEDVQSTEIASFSFNQPGQHTISLTVTDDDGETDKTEITIVVTNSAGDITNQNPTATITASANEVKVGNSLQFSASDSIDPDGSITHYEWSVDGKVVSTKAQLTHQFTSAKTATLTLKVTDNKGAIGIDNKAISVLPVDQNLSPVAIISGIQTLSIQPNENLILNADSSYDDDGTITSTSWAVEDKNYSGNSLEYRFTKEGVYIVTLTVTDNDGAQNSTTQSITVQTQPIDQLPIAHIMPSGIQRIEVGQSLTFDGADSSDAEGQITYSWNNGETSPSFSHTFTNAGNEKLCLTVTDTAKQQDSTCVSIQVVEPATSTIIYYNGSMEYVHLWNIEATPAIAATSWDAPASLQVLDADWKQYDFGQFIDSAQVIFRDLAGNKDGGNLVFDPAKPCYQNGSWVTMSECQIADTQAPVITASPAAGNYEASFLSISINSDDQDDEVTVYYTTDGTMPTTSSSLYKGAIAISDSVDNAIDTTIKAFGVDSSGNRSEVVSFGYKLNEDATAPIVTSTLNTGNYETSQTTTLEITDNRDGELTIYYTTDGSEPTTSSTQYNSNTITLSDGRTQIRALGMDASGNQKEYKFNYFIGELPISTDFREETIYFMLTTRFYDGDESNNYYNRDRIEEGDPHWRGDFKGLISKLDYLKDLGFTAIWITPPVENRSGLDYHGYHAYDWETIDPRLESADADYQDLIDEAHARGMKIIQDVVINHSSNLGIRGKVWIPRLPLKFYTDAKLEAEGVTAPYTDNLGDYKSPIRDDNDNPVAPEWFKELRQKDPADGPFFVPEVTDLPLPNKDVSKMWFWFNDYPNLDTNWYHATTNTTSGDYENPEQLWITSMANDCVDLCTGPECPLVREYLNNAIYRYLDMGVDAIRVDTLKHMPREDALFFVNAWQKHKPGLFVFGEALVKGYGLGSENGGDNASAVIRPWWYTRLGDDPGNPESGGYSGLSVLDFGLFSQFRDSLSKGSFSGIGGVLANDWYYGDPTQLVTFLQNHDLGPQNDWKRRFDGSQADLAISYNMLWTIRGIPTLFYGAEIEFQSGKEIDPAEISPDAMLSESGRAYFGDHLEADTIAATQSHPIYQHVKRLNQIRRAIPALQKGEMDNIKEWSAGMSFSRSYTGEDGSTSYVVVGLASSEGAQSITVEGIKAGTYVDAVTGNSITTSDGSISFNVPAAGAGIYLLNGSGMIGEAGTYLK